MTKRVITSRREHVTSLTTSVSTMRFLLEIMFILKAIKFFFKGSYDKQDLTLVVISNQRTRVDKGCFSPMPKISFTLSNYRFVTWDKNYRRYFVI